MDGLFYVLLLLGIFAVFCKGADLCNEKECTVQGQICVVNNHHQAECKCRMSCPKSSDHEKVCGSDGITYRSRCVLDMTSCRLALSDPITLVSIGRCQGNSLKVSAAHHSSQTLLLGKRGEIYCGIEGKAAQILWRKVGMKHHLPFRRLLPRHAYSKILRFLHVNKQDAGTYECRAYSGSGSAVATVVVDVLDPVSVGNNVASTQVCHLEKLLGIGTNFTTRWYFNSRSATCHPFLYSGVGGNQNNFKSKLLCLQKCSHAAGDICSLPKRPGLCMAYFPRWFYDTSKGECKSFVYGGCNANANNFKTKDECDETCSAERICGLQPKRGPCRAYLPRYFFNQTSEKCEKFIYGGCQGNSNNFPTSELCQKKCKKNIPVAERNIQGVRGKPGRCPWQRSPPIFCIMSRDACQSDKECQGSQKCCQFGCGKACVLPLSENKPGKCPRVEQNKGICNKRGDMCIKDIDCPGIHKCCFNGCQKDCSVPEALKRVKPGVCPGVNAINPDLCKNTKHECKQDADCFGPLKCCFNGCYNECLKRPRPRPKPGICPLADYVPSENCSDTVDKCSDDTQCSGRDKCCATGCRQECITPPVQKKPGLCPIVDFIPLERCEVTEDECQEDVDCEAWDKCCATGCIKECITPPILPSVEEKPGECPLPDYLPRDRCEVTEYECKNDNDCEGKEKCCETGCIKECLTPVVRKEGQCPKPWKGSDGVCDRRGDMCDSDVGCDGRSKCCFNGCQRDCVNASTGRLSDGPGQCPKPWKEQPCDRRGDMCDADDDCGDFGQRCCFNGCQKDCVKPVNLTKCQEESLAAADKLSQDPPLLGVFVPNCKPDGQYEDKQCHELYCWCVDNDGKEIPGTTVRGGSPVCYRQVKPGKCPKPWKGQNGICDRRGSMCHHDSDCRQDDRCCFNGCQNDCVTPVGIRLCKKHKDIQIAAIQPGFVGAFIPSCKLNGDYENIQCHGSTGYCWCVDELGNELPGTRTRGKPNCTNSASEKGAGKEGTCPKPWKGMTGFCDKMADQCGLDYHCGETEKCCFSGCQRMCVNTTEAHQKAGTRPGKCPKPWLGQEGLCDRRGDMCLQDVDCKGSEICCSNGCQNECVIPGLTTCQRRFEESFLFPPLGRFIPRCRKDGRFHEVQCHPSTFHCWCVNSYGIDLLGTRRKRGRPNCTLPDPCASTQCPYYGNCVVSKDRKAVECKCSVGCVAVYEPVCGTDSITYPNECSMRSMACLEKKYIKVAYEGECEAVDLCASVRCDFYAVCDVINGSVTCVCPGSGSRPSCSDEKKPVCGSDGVVYNNLCYLMNATCQQQLSIRPALAENCETQVDPCSNATCAHRLQKCKATGEGKPVCECERIACTREHRPVCGTDGETYSNMCMMKVLTCEANKIVSVDYEGECRKRDSDSEDLCSKVTCSHHIARCEVKNEKATCVCPNMVTMEYFPVCGSDGVSYPNPGSLQIASCNSGGAITKLHNGLCSKLAKPCDVGFCSHKRHRCEVQNGTAVCVCSTVCTLEYAPVCASDNKSYPNRCAMEVAECESGQRLRVVRRGQCDGVLAYHKPHVCPRPWKGHDGICDRRGDACDSNADCVVQGGGKCCFNGCQRDCVQFGDADCPQNCHHNAQCIKVNRDKRCVCNPGFEGDGIECGADPCSVKKCEYYSVCTESHGIGKCVCPQVCPALYAPVCGSDGNVYDNKCQMEVASCTQQKKITLASKDTCKPDPCKKSKCSHPFHKCLQTTEGYACICPPSACTREYAPVCGSDGKTYPNACVLRGTACERSQNITLKSQGECTDNNENPCDVPALCSHPHHQCQVVGTTAMCTCPMAIPANLDPVCGSDGETYPNSGALETLSCVANRIVELQYKGSCVVPTDPCDSSFCSHPRHRCEVVEGFATCVCNEICPLILMPVCGSDGQSYPNNCSLEVEACTSGKKLTVVAMGECGVQPGQCPVLNPTPGCVGEINGCLSDDECSLGQRCCLQENCTRECIEAKDMPPPSQLQACPALDPTPACRLSPDAAPSCFTGGPKCPAGQACCLDKDCNHKCVKPALPDGSRPGECPALNPIPGCATITGCDSDKRCALGERCCLHSDCTRKCINMDIPAPSLPQIRLSAGRKNFEYRHPTSANPACDPPCHRYAKCIKIPAIGKHECSCLRRCRRIYKPVCGTDGVVYSNECMLMYLVCKKGTAASLKHSGKCKEVKQNSVCPSLRTMPTCAFITGCSSDFDCPDGEKCCLQQDCTRKCYPQAKAGQCPTFKPRPCSPLLKHDECTTDWDCAGELKCCSDGCERKCSSFLRETGGNPCESALCSYPHPVCKVVENNATCQCRQLCPQHHDPVCGSDGHTYDNMCMLELMACNLEDGGMAAGKLTYIGNGNCTVAQICSLPPETGRCRASMRRFFFNATSRTCEQFRFGGCEGNANRFDTRALCNDYCGALDACQLNPCPDPYAMCSISDSGERECACPQICTADYRPVCGTDGQTYNNECQMKVSACSQGMMIKIKSRGSCRNNPGFCPIVDPRMCSGDQEDVCFDDASCLSNEKCCHDGCRKNCVRPLPMPNAAPHQKRVPQVLHSFSKQPHLEHPCKNCKFPKTACKLHDGKVQCECPAVCTQEFAPVCGSDGRNYSNKCQLQVEACKPENIRTLRVKHFGPCVCDLRPADGPCFGYIVRFFFNATTERCERFIYGGCQGNGNNFDTVESCENKCISPCKHYSCPFPQTVCEVEGGRAVCKCPTMCTASYRPVCGTDGRTYGSMCLLEAAACRTKHIKLQLKYLGECLSVNPCDGFVCSHKRHRCAVKRGKAVCLCSELCTREFDPYCASDGITYPNKCNLEVAECKSGKSLAVLHPGKCTACDLPPETGLCRAYIPSYFYNATSKQCVEFIYGGCAGNKNRFITIDDCRKTCKANSDDPCLLHECPFHGVCRVAEMGNPMCECITDCPGINDPVCGSDGKNYSSECVLKSQACHTKTLVHVVGGPAKCTSNRLRCKSCPPRSNLFTHICESDFVIEGTLEEITSTDGDDSSLLMVRVTGVFKGTDSIQKKIIKIALAANLNGCFCKELQIRKVVVIAGSTAGDGGYFLSKSSSFVRHSGKRLLDKVQQCVKRNKCSKVKKGD